MKITCSAFGEGQSVPAKYTADGTNVSPPLRFEGVPSGSKSLAVITEDPDAPDGVFCHWVLYDINPKITEIKEGTVPVFATQGYNDFGDVEYRGPKPPSGEHRYFFKLYALDTVLGLPRGAKRQDVLTAMEGHILDEASAMGRYARMAKAA